MDAPCKGTADFIKTALFPDSCADLLCFFLYRLACHTLPYTCCLVEDEENEQMKPDMTLEIRRTDNRAVGIHTPDQGEEPKADPPQPPSALPHHLQAHNLSGNTSNGAATPKSILVNPMEQAGAAIRNGSASPNGSSANGNNLSTQPPGLTRKSTSFVDLLAQKTAALGMKQDEEANAPKHSSHNPSRWVLTPRRGHAALNAGIRAMSHNADVTLVAWPGDMRRGALSQPEQEGFGDLTEEELTPELKKDLANGLAAMGGIGKGPRCSPVWVDSQTSKLFYDGYCKTFLWVRCLDSFTCACHVADPPDHPS